MVRQSDQFFGHTGTTRGRATSCCFLGTRTAAARGRCSVASEWVGSCATIIVRRRDSASAGPILWPYEFKTALIQAEADARRLEHEAILAQLRDVQSAREQTVRLAEARSPIAYGAVLVSAIVLVGFAVMLWLVIKEEVPANQRDMVTLLLGTLAGMASSVVAYWVGSSNGSMQKNAALEKALANR